MLFKDNLFKIDVPEGVRGDFRVEWYQVPEESLPMQQIRAVVEGHNRFVPPGSYTCLRHEKRGILMSDTPDELKDLRFLFWHATGQCLVFGLGLGVAVQGLLGSSNAVSRVTVVELEPDVIALVGSHYQAKFGDRLEIIQGDAFSWKPPRGARYEVVWADIWDTIGIENVPEMQILRKRYQWRTKWFGCWCEAESRRCR